MPKVNIKRGRPKSYEEKLRERQERMTIIDRQEVVFMPGENLSDNDDDEDAPLEVVTKREILPLIDEEPELPEIQIQPKKPEKKKKQKITRVDEGEFALKVDNSVKLKIKAPSEKNWAAKNKMSFREKLLQANTKNIRSARFGKPNGHVSKWARRRK